MSARQLHPAIRPPGFAAILQRQTVLLACALFPALAHAQFSDELPPTLGVRALQVSPCAKFDASVPLDYATALRTAVCISPNLGKAVGAISEQAAGRRKALGAYLPNVSLSANTSRFGKSVSYPEFPSADYGLHGRTGGYDATLTWLLYDFGLREANLDTAVHMLSASVWEARAVVRDVAESTGSAFFKARAAVAASAAAQDAERSAQTNLATAAALFRKGAGTLSDRLLAESAYEQAVLRRIDADSESRTANATLASAIGSGASTTLRIKPGPVELDAGGVAATDDDLFRIGLALNPKVNALREQVDAAQARVSAAKRDGLPSISVSAGQYRTTTPPNESNVAQDVKGWSVGIQVRIPVFDGFQRRSNVDAALAQLTQKTSELEVANRDAELAIWSVKEELLRQREKFRRTARILSIAQNAVDVAKARYMHGVGSMLEVLKCESDWIDAQRANIRTAADLDLAKLRFVLQTTEAGESTFIN